MQTDGVAKEITHINALSLQDVAASCREVAAEEVAAAAGAGLLTSVSRGGVTVRALAVAAVHSGLLAPPVAAAGQLTADEAAEERRLLQRAAVRLTWGLAGIVFELMHRRAGHWLALGPVERQAAAGAALTQLYT